MAGTGDYLIRYIGDASSVMKSLAEMDAAHATFAAKVKALGTKMAAVGKSMTMFVTLPIVLAGAASVKMASDYQASMSKIEGLVGASERQIDAYSESILGMASAVGKSPKELADALFFITSAGLEGAEALDALEWSAKAAAAGLGETKVVADAVTSAMNTYATSNMTAEQATDVLVNTVRLGKMEASSLAPVLGGVIPVANQMGVSFEEVGAAMATMTRQGIDAASGATSLRFLMMSFMKPTQEAQDALKGVGLSVGEVQRSIDQNGLNATLIDLARRFDLSTAAGKMAFATVVGGARGMKGASILVQNHGKIATQMLEEMSESAGQTGRAFEVVTGDTEFQMEQMKSALSGAAIAFGNILLPVINKIAGAFTALGQWLAHLSPGTQEVIVKVLALAAAIGPLVWIVGALMAAISPVTIIIAAVAAAIALLVRYITSSEERLAAFKAAATAVWSALKQAWAVVVELAAVFWEALQPALQDIWLGLQDLWGSLKQLMPVLKVVGAVIGLAVIGALMLLVAAVKLVAWAFKAIIVPVLKFLVTAFRMAWGFIKGIVLTVAKVISTVLKAAAAVWKAVVVNGWQNIKSATSSVWSAIKGAIGTAIGWIRDAIGNGLSWIREKWSDVWNTIKGIGAGVWDAIATGMKNGINFLIGIVERGLNALITAYNKVANLPGNPLPNVGPLTLPRLATGTSNFRGGLALVGERGPELVGLPRHTAVLPSSRTRAVMAHGMATRGTTVVVNVTGNVVTEGQLVDAIHKGLLSKRRVTGAPSLGLG